jgi:DNA repair exonuclease SbcCD ATPase subunit
VPTVADVGLVRLRERLTQSEAELADLLATARAVEQRLSLNEAQLIALDRRIGALEEERDRNQDVKTLLRLGGEHPTDHLSDSDCPTCHQSLASIEIGSLGPSLSIDETLGLLNAQLATMRGMREQAATAVERGRNAYAAVQRAADSARSQVRAVQADLVAPADYPSAADITERVVAETRLGELDRLTATVRSTLDRLQQVADDVAEARTSLNRLPSATPDEDVRRRERLTHLMHEQLGDFGFSSYDSQKIGINEETLRPERAGFDIDTDISATDVVRTKIAYLNAIRELAGEVDGPHPGLLILDEPRQHELDEEHFRLTLSRLASSSSLGNQVIVTSAAPMTALAEMLGDNAATIVDLGGRRLIQREPPDDRLDLGE